MMLNHLNLCARDVAALTETFVRHFAFEMVEKGTVPAAVEGQSGAFAMLRNGAGFLLVVTQIHSDVATAYPRGFHVGILVETAEMVRAKHAELSDAGFDPRPVNAFTALGADWTAFYCPVGDGIEIEITACSRTVGQLRKAGDDAA